MSASTESKLLEASIERVWNEHNETKRLAAIKDIYHPDARIFEPTRSITGHQAISDTVRAVLADMPPGFEFAVIGPTLGHHEVAVTRWQGIADTNVIVSGSDVARIKDGLIIEHFFYFDPAP